MTEHKELFAWELLRGNEETRLKCETKHHLLEKIVSFTRRYIQEQRQPLFNCLLLCSFFFYYVLKAELQKDGKDTTTSVPDENVLL